MITLLLLYLCFGTFSQNCQQSSCKPSKSSQAPDQVALFQPPSSIAQLNVSNFDEYVGQNQTCLLLLLFFFVSRPTTDVILFYGTWCGHCKQFYPTFVDVAETVLRRNDLAVSFGQVSSTESTLIDQFDVQGFPTLKMFPQNSSLISTTYALLSSVYSFNRISAPLDLRISRFS